MMRRICHKDIFFSYPCSFLEVRLTLHPAVEESTRVMVCFSTPVSSIFRPVGNFITGKCKRIRTTV